MYMCICRGIHGTFLLFLNSASKKSSSKNPDSLSLLHLFLLCLLQPPSSSSSSQPDSSLPSLSLSLHSSSSGYSLEGMKTHPYQVSSDSYTHVDNYYRAIFLLWAGQAGVRNEVHIPVSDSHLKLSYDDIIIAHSFILEMVFTFYSRTFLHHRGWDLIFQKWHLHQPVSRDVSCQTDRDGQIWQALL